MNLAAARALAESDPKIRAAVETSDSVPMRESENVDVRVFKLVKDADALFKDLFESHEQDGWVLTTGSKTRGFAIFEREDEVFGLHLDKRSKYDPPKEG